MSERQNTATAGTADTVLTRNTRPADAEPTTAATAKPGTWIWYDGEPRHLRHVEPYTDDHEARALLVFAGGRIADWPAGQAVTLASDEQIAEAKEGAHRAQIVTGLRALADLIESQQLPLPKFGVRLSGSFNTEADARRWAKAPGVALTEPTDGSPYVNVEWAHPSLGAEVHERLVEVDLYARPAKAAGSDGAR